MPRLAHQTRRGVAIAAVLCSLLLVPVACGSGSSTSAADDTTRTTGAQPTGAPIKLMLIYEKSEGLANPDLPDGAEAAVDAINVSGGIGGRPLDLIVCDTRNDPNVAAGCAQRAVDEGVVASVGNISQQSGSYYPIFEEKKIPVIGEGPATAASYTSAASFPIAGGAVSNFAGLGRSVADAGAEVISVVRPDIAGGEIAKTMVDKGLAPVGKSVENDVAVPTDAPDMAQYAQAALAGGSDGLVVGLPGGQAVNLVQAAKQVKPDVKIGFIASSLDQVGSALGSDAEGLIQADFLLPVSVDTAGTSQYLADMKAAGFSDVGGQRSASWLAVQVFTSVARGLPDVTGPAVFDQLGRTTGLETGLTPPLQWIKGDVGGIPRVFNGCTIATTLDASGKEQPVTGRFFDPFAGTDCETPS